MIIFNLNISNLNIQSKNLNKNEEYWTFHFIQSVGFKTNMESERTTSIKDMFKEYANKIEVSEETIVEKIFYFF